MRAVHPMFHVSQLEPAMPNTIPNRSQPLPPPVKVDGEPKYEITKILDSKLDQQRRQCPLLYLVRWAGYEGTDEETSCVKSGSSLGQSPDEFRIKGMRTEEQRLA